MHVIEINDVRSWLAGGGGLSEFVGTIGVKRADEDYLEESLGIPEHVAFVVEKLAAESARPLPADALDSLPFYSLCRGLLLPLSQLAPERAGQIFGLETDPPPDAAGRERLLEEFFNKDAGLTLAEKIGCVLGDPFLGRRSGFRRESLLRLLMSVELVSRRELLDKLTRVGDVAVLFAQSKTELRGEPPLASAEVLRTLRLLPDERTNRRFSLLRSLLARCGRVEAFFLARLLLRKAGFGFDYQGPLLTRRLADAYGAEEDQVARATALTDVFHVAEALQNEGAAGLKAIQLQPLVPVRPALAGGTVDDLDRFPVWVERKYDGIRFMLHKSSDPYGSVLCGAYTRTRGDWLEQVVGLDASIKALPAASAIVDGELFGTVLDVEGVRPATVYEVHSSLQGGAPRPVSLKFAAFDLLFLNGHDLTGLPLSERRRRLSMLALPLAGLPLPIPIALAEGQLAQSKHDVNRLYEHFRAQGYEGVITKDLAGTYQLGVRDREWRKRKPLVTLDLVLLGATYAVTTKERTGVFGSYVIGARTGDRGFDDVGDVAGVDVARDQEIQQTILREGLFTGNRIERPSASGARPGIELLPYIVVTVKFEGIIRDQSTGELSLRDPKLATIRADKSPHEADTVQAIEQLYLRQRVG